MAHFFLANTYAGQGNSKDALVSINKAIEFYEADPIPEMKRIYRGMKQMRKQLGGKE